MKITKIPYIHVECSECKRTEMYMFMIEHKYLPVIYYLCEKHLIGYALEVINFLEGEVMIHAGIMTLLFNFVFGDHQAEMIDGNFLLNEWSPNYVQS